MSLKRWSALVLIGVWLAGIRPAAAEQVFFFVRHAERAAAAQSPGSSQHSMLAEDPPLSAAGERRAARLAAILSASGIKAIYTTEFKRTRQTAAPLAGKLGITPVMSAAKDPAPLIAQLKKAQAPALVVGHANTVPDLIKALGVAEAVSIGDNEYDNLFVVVRSESGTATLIRLKY
jgi:phosphohistidine phosphatase SixA